MMRRRDMLSALANSLTDEQWELMKQLKESRSKDKILFLSSILRPPKKISSRKASARELQNTACQVVSEVTGIDWGKDQQISSRPMGQSGPDVILSPEVRTKFPFTIECKSGSMSLRKTINQVKTNRYPNTNWLIIYNNPKRTKEERVEPVAILSLWVLKEVLKYCKLELVPIEVE